MKKTILIICLLAVLGAAAAWWFMRDTDHARDAVPARATAALVLEPAELIDGLGLSTDQVSRLGWNLDDLLRAIDLRKPLYAFSCEDGLAGVSLNLNSAEDLRKAISRLGLVSEEDDGLHMIKGDKFMGCFDDDKLLLCTSTGQSRPTALRNELTALMTQDRQDVDALRKADRQDGLLRLSVPFSALPQGSIPQGLDLSDASFGSALSIGKKDISLSLDFQVPQQDLPAKPIRGTLADVWPDEPCCWICLNVEGEQLLGTMRQNQTLRDMLLALGTGLFDADMMIKSVSGDVLIAMPRLNLRQPELLMIATLKDTDFLKEVRNWNFTSDFEGTSLRRRGPSDFLLTAGGEQIYFGVRNGRLYVASTEQLADKACHGGSSDFPKKKVAGRYLSAAIDIGQMLGSYPEARLLLTTLPQLGEALDAIDCITLTSDSPQGIEVSLQTKKPVRDVFRNLWSLLSAK